MSGLRKISYAACLVASVSTAARAQGRPVAHLGDHVRLVPHGEPAIIGELMAITRDSVWYWEPCGDCARRSMARTSIDSLAIRARIPARPLRVAAGALVGAGAAAIGWIASVFHADRDCHDGPCGIGVIYTPIVALLGGVAGGFVGWLTPVEGWVPADLPGA